MAAHDRWLAGAVVAWVLFIVYGSLVPLDWQPQPLDATWQAFVALPLPRFGVSAGIDAAVNFLLTVPPAFGLAHLLSPRKGASGSGRVGSAWVWLAVAVVLGLLSLGIEFAQMFFPPRSPSWSDVVAQWCGTLFGLGLHMRYGRSAGGALQGLGAHPAGTGTAARWLAVWLGGLLLFSLMPLDLSLLPVELYRKWRDGRVLLWPFSGQADGWDQAVYGWVSESLLWLPVGALWRIDGHHRSLRQIVGRGLVVALAIELMQLFVMSRVTDVTDILLAGAGVLLGAALVAPVRAALKAPPALRQRRIGAAVALWGLVALFVLWMPFDFRPDRVSAAAFNEAFLRLPFLTYVSRGEFGALSEILRKLLVFLPAGLLIGAAFAGAARPPRWPLAGVALLAFVLEAGQIALPGKVADLTDAVLGCVGAWLGWRIARLAVAPMPMPMPSPMPMPMPTSNAPIPPAAAGGARAARRAGRPSSIPRELATSLLSVVLLAGLIWTLGRLSDLPYNVAKLMPAGPQGVAAALALALALWWMLAAPLLVLHPSRRAWRLGLPALAVGHALVTFILLRLTVPLPMLHKIVGYPVLAWGGWWEDAGRYVALHLSVMMPVMGAMFLVHAAWRPRALASFVGWGFAALLLFWPLHAVVVVWAGTDNLVELMRDGGSVAASLALAGALGWGAVAASALSLGLAQPAQRRALAVMALLGLVLAPLLAHYGLQDRLEKYDDSFSALQFLLSASRSRYATGDELAWRAVMAGAAFLLCVAALQFPMWRSLADAGARRQATPAPGSGRLRPA